MLHFRKSDNTNIILFPDLKYKKAPIIEYKAENVFLNFYAGVFPKNHATGISVDKAQGQRSVFCIFTFLIYIPGKGK